VAAPVAAPAAASTPAAAAGDDDELAFQPGQRVTLTAPPAMAGKQGTVVGPALSGTFAVQLESGSIFNFPEENINGGAGSAPAPAVAPSVAAAPVATSVPAAAAGNDEELAFQPGERVTLTAPPAMAGKQGTVVGPALGETFAVQLDSGSIFNIAEANLQGAGGAAPAAASPMAAAPVVASTPAAAAGDDEELAFQPGERVTLTAPPAMAGKQGTVVGPALSGTFAVQLESGSIFNFPEENINGGAGSAPAPAAAAATPVASYAPSPASMSSTPSEEAEFEQGQLVQILAPPALAGKTGTIGGPALDDCWMVVLASGSVFNIKAESLKATVNA